MTVKAKRFRIGVEGATTDGREIQREWLEQMAASYNPAVYTALINLEHIKSYLPDSTFSRHMIGMSINLQTSGPHWVGAASYLGEEITIYPYINETIISGGTAHEGGAVHVIDTMRVNP